MNFPFFIAKRYLISKKSYNIINIISLISVMGITIGTAALIIVLSVFNGFEDLVISMFNSYSPDLIIETKEGKTFDNTSFSLSEIQKLENVVVFTEVIEENALAKYNDRQTIVRLKGIDDNYLKHTLLKEKVVEGDFIIKDETTNYGVFGYLVAYKLGLRLMNIPKAVNLYVPKRGKVNMAGIANALDQGRIFPSGIFMIEQEIDSKYVITSIDFVRELLNYQNEITAVEIIAEKNADIKSLKKKVETITGSGFTVKNRFEQQETLYKIMKSEKLAIFLILTFILIVAAFNVIGSLSILIMDKRKDIVVLKSLGASNNLIKQIFMHEGMLISIIGAIVGLLLGFLICQAQISFGLLSLGEEGSFIVSSYPVKMKLIDFVFVFATVFIIGVFAAWYPSQKITGRLLKL